MARNVDGVRIATTDEDIECLMKMARSVYAEDDKRKLIDFSSSEECRFVELVLEGADFGTLAELSGSWSGNCKFRVDDLYENDTKSAFVVKGTVASASEYDNMTLHMFVCTYNDDGPRRPVGVGDSVFLEKGEQMAQCFCTVRKGLLDAWHLGIMLTVVVLKEGKIGAEVRLLSLNDAQNEFYEGAK